jgi:ubiquinone biosynthesis protein UbiJ
MIKPLIINAFETALNQYLALDEDVSLFLSPIAGKVITINILPFNEIVYLCPTEDEIQVLENYVGKVDATISGTLSALGLMGLSSTPMRSIFSGEVVIEGDTQVAHKFQQLFEKLDIDLEEKLSQFTGDVIAHKIGNFSRSAQNWIDETVETFKLNSKDFLQEETRDLPTETEANILNHQIDEIRSDFDRLSARIALLQTNQSTPSRTETDQS